MNRPSPPSDKALDKILAETRRLHDAGRLQEAEAGYRDVLAADPTHVKARSLLGALLLQKGQPQSALPELEHAHHLRPDQPPILINLAAAYLGIGRARDAADACRRVLELAPENHEAHFNLGHALLDLRDWAGAVRAYEENIRLNPLDGRGYGALGDALKEKGEFDAAMVAFETAMTLAPDHPGAYLGVADLLLRRGWPHAALVVMDNIAAHLANDVVLQRRTAEMRLSMGQLAEGWDKFDETRLQSVGAKPQPEPPPHWRGEDLKGKRLLIWSEQGLGDEVLYAGLVPDVIARGAQCTIASSYRMTAVFKRSFPGADVTERSSVGDVGQFDFQVHAGSLGRFLRRSFTEFPAHTGYLKCDPREQTVRRRKYEDIARGRRIVGLAWKSVHNVLGSSKSAELANLGAILTVPGVMFVGLQYGDCSHDYAAARAKFGIEIYQDPDIDQRSDVEKFFAQVAAMDLVVSTSNSTAHVGGAMNIPTWLLLPRGRGALWYWFLQREDSPWYPSVKIIRGGLERDEPWEIQASKFAGAELARWQAQPAVGA
ncbi:MAG: tetratricopeptide repeat protein [Rhodospirillaceae bacterium]